MQSFIDVAVGAEDLQGIEFVQKGYLINIISTHDVDAFMTQPDSSPMKLKIKVGSFSNALSKNSRNLINM